VFRALRGVAGGVVGGVVGWAVFPLSMVYAIDGLAVPATDKLKYAHYGAFPTVTAWTLDGWTPAAWATAATRNPCCWSCSCVSGTTALPVVVKKYVHLYPLLHRQKWRVMEPLGDQVLAGHGWIVVVVLQKWFAGHGGHWLLEVSPVCSEYDPSGQAKTRPRPQ
jgi:hypothetical protein